MPLNLLICAFLNFPDQVEGAQGGEVVDGKILPYCSIDKKEKKSVGELEQEFLQALQVMRQILLFLFHAQINVFSSGCNYSNH